MEKIQFMVERWITLFHQLMFNSENAFMITDDMYVENIIGVVWTDYCFEKYENEISRCAKILFSLVLVKITQWNNALSSVTSQIA